MTTPYEESIYGQRPVVVSDVTNAPTFVCGHEHKEHEMSDSFSKIDEGAGFQEVGRSSHRFSSDQPSVQEIPKEMERRISDANPRPPAFGGAPYPRPPYTTPHPLVPLERTPTQFLGIMSKVYNPDRWAQGSGLAQQFQAQCQTVFPISMLLQEAKSRGYKNSWEKRGMLFSVWPNIGRKVDRLENLFQDIEDGKTSLKDPGTLHIFLTTSLDLYNYLGMGLQKVMREDPEAWDRLMKQVVHEIADDAPDLVSLAKFAAGIERQELDNDARTFIGKDAHGQRPVYLDNHGFAHIDEGDSDV